MLEWQKANGGRQTYSPQEDPGVVACARMWGPRAAARAPRLGAVFKDWVVCAPRLRPPVFFALRMRLRLRAHVLVSFP